MNIKKIPAVMLLFPAVLVVLCILFPPDIWAQEVPTTPLTGLKKRIAVFAFENKSDYGRGNVGTGMSDMLTTELVKSGKYRVIERAQIEGIMAEQQLGLTGAVTPQTAAKVGKLLGVELAVYGAVTEFGQRKTETGGALKQLNLKGGLTKTVARVAVDVRLVDTSTGEIIAADNVEAEQKKTGFALDTYDVNIQDRSQFDKTLVGKATRKCIEQIMGKIEAQIARLPWYGKIIKQSGDKVYINRGQDSGLAVGNVLNVYAPGEELIDPETGLVLGSEESKVGQVQIVQVLEKYSLAIPRSGSGFEAGYIVRDR